MLHIEECDWMKKWTSLIILLVCVLSLIGCSKLQNETDAGALPPTLIMNGEKYYANTMPMNELPDQFECMGEITDQEANGTGLQGCKYYANRYMNSFDEFYVYQECGTPINENQVDSIQRQWAYVKWVREGLERD